MCSIPVLPVAVLLKSIGLVINGQNFNLSFIYATTFVVDEATYI